MQVLTSSLKEEVTPEFSQGKQKTRHFINGGGYTDAFSTESWESTGCNVSPMALNNWLLTKENFKRK